MLTTLHRPREYKNGDKNRVAKFMPWFDGPYQVVDANPGKSTYTLVLPNQLNVFPVFHSSELRCFIPNNNSLSPSRSFAQPRLVITEDGEEEWQIEEIVDERKRGRSWQYLVK